MSLRELRQNIFELQPLEIRTLLTTATVDSNHVLQIIGSGGTDSITVNKNTSNKLTVTGVTATFSIGTGAGAANAIYLQAGGGNDTVLITSNVKDPSSNVPLPATITGNAGNDTITSGSGDDVLYGGDGNDSMDGGAGDDTLDGQGGADFMFGNSGMDTSDYSSRTNPVNVTLDGKANDGENNEGDNVQTEGVLGGAGNDTLIGSAGQDFLAGGGGADSIRGGGGNDQLTGSSGADQMFGENGDDFLQAQNNDKDTVNGGTNSDGTPDFDLANIDTIDVGAATAMVASASAPQQMGSDLDPSYGSGGKTLATALGWDSINGSAVDSQGRAYFVGTVADPNDTFGGSFNDDMAVARFDANGNFDTTFSGGNVAGAPAGEARIDFSSIDGAAYGPTDDFASGIIIAPGDKVIVFGSTNPSDSSSVMAVARLLPDGTLDNSFGRLANETLRSGMQSVDITGSAGSGYGDDATDAAVQTDGKIALAGIYDDGNGGDFAVARLLDNGTIDNTFNSLGYNTLDIDDGSFDHATSIALQSLPGDGGAQRIVVGGDSDSLFAIARFNANGSLDSTFGNSGSTTTDFGGSNSLEDLAVNSQNQIIAVGNVSSSEVAGITSDAVPLVQAGQEDAVLAVYASNGQGAPNFVDQPPTTGSFISFDAVAIDSQNRIVVAGEQNNDFVVGRYLSNLSMDSTFSNGLVTVDFSSNPSAFNEEDFPLAVGIGSNHTITVTGVNIAGGEEGTSGMVAVRFIGDVPVQFPPPPPVTGEANVTGIEGIVSYAQLHQNPPPPPLDALLNSDSTGERLYLLSQPDNNGQVDIDLRPLGDTGRTITISSVDTGHDKTKEKDIEVQISDVETLYYAVDTTSRIIIHAGGGNDSFQVKGDVRVPLVLDGGAGNDTMQGGHGDDMLLGGPGADTIKDDDGSNVIIGGGGGDSIHGSGHEDLIIAGTTAYDSDEASLLRVLDEWSTNQQVSSRISHLRNGTGINGPVVLIASGIHATVFDDGVKDSIDPAGGKDWIFARISGPNADQINGLNGDKVLDQI